MPTCEGCKHYVAVTVGHQCHRWDFTFGRGKPKPLYANCFVRKKQTEGQQDEN